MKEKTIELEKTERPPSPRKRKSMKEIGCRLEVESTSLAKRLVKMNSEVIQLKINPNIMTMQNVPPPPFFTNSTDDLFETDENLVCYSVPRANNSSDLNILNNISYFPERDYNALLGIHET